MPLHTSQSPAANEDNNSLAQQADRYALYERAVQCPEAEVDFITETFLALRGRHARSLAEDFCGSAAVCCEWIRRDPSNVAIGIDSDADVLSWTLRQRVPLLEPDAQARLRLIEADVLDVGPVHEDTEHGNRVDLILAMNFSWWLFTDRSTLLRYFRRVHERLRADGLFILDNFGGYDAFRVITEERPIEDGEAGFTYIWDQTDYDPISGAMQCAIHFAFPDGSRLERAFSYTWRLWTLPELREILVEAGFRNLQIYWQGWSEEGEADGVFRPVQRADPDAGWICYLSADP